MHRSRVAAVGLLATLALGSGCSVVREIPRADYAARDERRNVRIVTRDNFEYDFEFVRVSGDTLTGYRRLDTDSPIDEYRATRLALADIERLQSRRVDWVRTGLVGAAALGSVIAIGLRSDDPAPATPGGPGRVE
jgi:hypothetical protein